MSEKEVFVEDSLDMAAERLYYQDPHMREFDARVISCAPGKHGFDVVLDRTAFYPEGGGQPGDTGTLGGVRVSDTHERGGEIVHYCDAPLEAGSRVHGALDWQRRFDLMQQHSGEHLVSGIIHRRFGYDNVGFHMGAEMITIDLSGMLTPEQLRAVEREANEAVWRDLPTEITYPDAETLRTLPYRSKKELSGEVRIVTFPGVDICACCGTHVKSTGEIGLIKIFSCEKFHEGVRLELLCGRRALEYLNGIYAQNRQVSGLLSAKPMETADGVRRTLDELSRQKARAAALETRVIEVQAAQYAGAGSLLLFEDGLSPDALRRLTDAVMTQCGGRCAIFSGTDAEGYKYCVGEAGGDLRELTKALNTALRGRGGGKPFFVQGSVQAPRSEIEAFFKAEGAL